MTSNGNAIPFDKLVEASGYSEDELLRRLAGILSERLEMPAELMDNRPRDPATGDLYEGAIPADAITSELTRLRARVQELEAASHIDFYEREFYPLSNFSAFCLDWEGFPFATSEAVYHWEKFRGQPGIQLEILRARSAHDAFKLAERFRDRRRPDWDEIKVAVMLRILQAKATQHEYVRRKLLETGDHTLIECSWRDDFWGWGANKDGQNMLGKLWMQVRDEIREAARRALEATDAND